MARLTNLIAQIKISPNDVNLPNAATANSSALQSTLSLVYFIAGIVCVVLIIIGGVRYTTSGGDAGGVQSAKNTIIYAIVGLIVVLSAAAVTQLIFSRF